MMARMLPLSVLVAMSCASPNECELPDTQAFLPPLELRDAQKVQDTELALGAIRYTLPAQMHSNVFIPLSPYSMKQFTSADQKWDYTQDKRSQPKFQPSVAPSMFFHRPSPVDFLNIELQYTPADTFIAATATHAELHYDEASSVVVLKIFHRDVNFEDSFPQWRKTAPFDLIRFDQVLTCVEERVKTLADSMGMTMIWEGGRFHALETRIDSFQYGEAGHLDLLHATLWENKTSRDALLFACQPARRWGAYEVHTTGDTCLFYNVSKGRLDRIPWSDLGWGGNPIINLTGAFDIRPGDLAIWVVYEPGWQVRTRAGEEYQQDIERRLRSVPELPQ